MAHRGRGQHRVGDVVDADQDHGDVGLGRQRAVDLAGQVGGLGRRPRRTRAGGPGGRRGSARPLARWAPGRLLDPVDAVAGGARVAEQRDLDGGPGAAAAVPAGGVGRRVVAGLADGLAGQRRLGARARRTARAPSAERPPPPYAAAAASLRAAAAFPTAQLYGRAESAWRLRALDWRVQYVNSLLDLIGNTPLLRLHALASTALASGAAGAGEGGVPQPRRVGEGPDRDPDDRGRRGLRRAPARRHDRRADLRQHRRRPGDGGPGEGLPVRLRLPRQGQRGQAQRAQGVRRRGGRLPDRGGARSTRTPTTTSPTGSPSQPGAWKPDQYSNPHNPRSHYETTGPEIWEQTEGRITHFVAGVGTGGTITGVGRYLKEQNPDVQVIGADPAGSVYSGGTGRPYLVEGVGEDFWPETYDRDIADRIIEVSDADSFAFTRRLAREEALLVGGSSGMAAYAARQLAHELAGTPEGDDAVIVVLLPDSGRGYLTKVFNDEWLAPVRLRHRRADADRADRRRGAARQDRPAARPGAHPPQRDHRRGGARSCRSTASRRCPWSGPSRRSWPPRSPARSPSATLLDALFAGHARLTDPVEEHMSRAAADDRLHRARPARRSRCSRTPTRCSCRRTASRSACSPGRTCWPSSRSG